MKSCNALHKAIPEFLLFLSNFSLVFLLDHLSRHVQKNETYEKLQRRPKTKAVVGCAGSNGCHETDGCCGCPGL